MVGGELAARLVENKHDIVIIDRDKEVCDRLYSELGIVAIHGNAAHIETLNEAGIKKADVIVASMRDDVDKLACVTLAKSFGVQRIVVRMRDPAYAEAYKIAGATSIVRVMDLLINEMIMDIEQPEVRRIMTISSGRGEIFMVVIPKGAKVAGKNVESITKSQKFPNQCVFIAVHNPSVEEISFPKGEHIINEGDSVFLIAPAEDVKKAADFLISK